MTIRQFALAAIPLLGIACSHASKQAKAQDHTGAMWSERETEAQEAMEAETRTVSATPEDALAASQGTGSQGESTSGSSPNTGGSSASQEQGSPSGSSTGSSDPGSSMGQGGSMGQSDSGAGAAGMGKSSGSESGASGGMSGMSGAKKHAGAHRVSGKISEISSDSVTITPKKGDAKTLKIGPDTKVSMNGKPAQPTDLKQGQQVRASYDSSGGEDMATQITTGKGGGAHARRSKASGGTGSMGGSSK